MKLEFFVRRKRITRKGNAPLVGDTAGHYTFSVDFDEEWAGLAKVVVFQNGAHTAQLLYTGETYLPAQVCGRGELYVACHGYKTLGDETAVVRTIRMTRPVRLLGSAPMDGDEAQPYTPTLFEQVVAAAAAAKEQAERLEHAGAGGRTVMVTPQDYGALGDGVTDDSAAFQKAVDSGFDVQIPSGCYRVGCVNITRPVSVVGMGDVRLKIPDGIELPAADFWTEATTVFLTRGVDNVKIENIHFDGNLAHFQDKYGYGPLARFDSYGVRVRDESKNVSIRRCRFDDFKDAGVQITSLCQYVTVEECQFFPEGWPGTFNRGIQAVQSAETHDAYYTFRNNRIQNTGEHGIIVYYNNYHCVIDGNYIKGSGLLYENPDGSSSYTGGCNIKASGGSYLTIVNNYCEDAINANIGLFGSKDDYLRENIVANNVCIGSDREAFKGTGISCENGSVIVSGNIIKNVHVRQYSQSSAMVIGTADAVISGNRIENCDVGIRSSGAPITGNFIQAAAPIVMPVCVDTTIANNTLIGDGTQDGISIYDAKNVVISGNAIANVRYGIMGRTAADGVTIYGNVFDGASRMVNWYGFTPWNTKIDFELQYTTDLAGIQKTVQAGNGAASYPVGTQFLVPYQYEGKTYTFVWNVVDHQTVVLEDGSAVPGMVLQAHFASIESPIFDGPENEIATEETFTEGYYYYLADSSVSSGYALQTGVVYGEAIPTDQVYYHSAIRDTTGRIVATGYSRWAHSAIRQWLNSGKSRGSWWTAQHPGDLAPADAGVYDGFLAGFQKEFLSILKPVKVSTYAWNVGLEDTYDTFFLPSLEQIYAAPANEGEGAAFAYWKDKLGSEEPTTTDVTYDGYIAKALEDGSTPRTWKLRSHGSNRYTTYVTHHTGRWTTVTPSTGHYVLPVCVVC